MVPTVLWSPDCWAVSPMTRRFRPALKRQKAGFSFQITRGTLRGAHPNTVKIEVVGEHGSQLEVIGSSIGGGRIRICEIDGIRTDFSGEYNTIIVHNTDTPDTWHR